MSAVHLDDASIEAVALRVAELIRDEAVTGGSSGELVDAAEIARCFGVSRDWVYDHADELGAVRLGDGPKARLRFDPATVAERLGTPDERSEVRRAASRPRRRSTSTVDLLPIRGSGQ